MIVSTKMIYHVLIAIYQKILLTIISSDFIVRGINLQRVKEIICISKNKSFELNINLFPFGSVRH